MFITHIFLVLVVGILFDCFWRLQKHGGLQNFNGPSLTLPIIGNSLELVVHPSELGSKLRSCFRKYGTTWKFFGLYQSTLFTCDPKLVNELLSTNNHLQKHLIYDNTVKPILGHYGLGTSEVDQWKDDRKLFNKVFNPEFLQITFATSRDLWLNTEKKIVGVVGEPTRCSELFKMHFLSTFLLSNSVDSSLIPEEALNHLIREFENAQYLSNVRVCKPWTQNSILWTLCGYSRLVTQLNDTVAKYVHEYISYNVMQSNGTLRQSSDLDIGKPRHISIGALMADNSKSEEWKCDHYKTLMAGGTDTTAIAATMTLFFLALNAEYQRKAQKEVDELFESTDSLRYCDIAKLKYLKMCLKEAMRLHPTVPLIGRTTSKEILLDGGVKIPKGTGILVSLVELNLNSTNFPDPLAFKPERFDECNIPSFKPGSYIPFSLGPRNCIGKKYSECVLLPLLTLILRRFNVHTTQKAEDIRILYEATGTPFPHVEITFKQRRTTPQEL